jgi:hypothetical protein
MNIIEAFELAKSGTRVIGTEDSFPIKAVREGMWGESVISWYYKDVDNEWYKLEDIPVSEIFEDWEILSEIN